MDAFSNDECGAKGCGGNATMVGGFDEGGCDEGGCDVGGFTVEGFIVVGLSVTGADMGAIEGCVVGDGSDDAVRGATSILGEGGDNRPGKTVGGCASVPVSMTIGPTGRFTEAITAGGGSKRRVGSRLSSILFGGSGSTTVIAELDVVGRAAIATGATGGGRGMTTALDASSAYESESLSETTSRILIGSRTAT